MVGYNTPIVLLTQLITYPTGYAYEGQVIGLPMQSLRGGNFSIGGCFLSPPPLAPALV